LHGRVRFGGTWASRSSGSNQCQLHTQRALDLGFPSDALSCPVTYFAYVTGASTSDKTYLQQRRFAQRLADKAVKEFALPDGVERAVTHHCKELDEEQLRAFGPGLRVDIVSVWTVVSLVSPGNTCTACCSLSISIYNSMAVLVVRRHDQVQSTSLRSYCSTLSTARLGLRVLARQQDSNCIQIHRHHMHDVDLYTETPQ
jgi:hypothetical protein